MKVTNYISILFLAFGLMLNVSSFAQSPELSSSMEVWKLETDRSLYVAGERIFFSAINLNRKSLNHCYKSDVVYAELIASDGSRICGAKYPVNEGLADGSLYIPERALTGVYFLRIYTRASRGIQSSLFTYRQIKVFHPDLTEIITEKQSSLNERKTLFGQGQQNKILHPEILTDKSLYHPGDSAYISIRPINNLSGPLFISLSMVPVNTATEDDLSGYFQSSEGPERNIYPETRGLSLSGTLIDKNSNIILSNYRMSATIIGDKDIMLRKTDSAGRFYFSLPYHTGYRDIYLSSEIKSGASPEIRVDNDFGKSMLPFTPPEFKLDTSQSRAALQLIRNHRIRLAFEKDSIPNPSVDKISSFSFYGKEPDVLLLDKYIDLPTLEDYFKEIPVMVNIRKSEGKRSFRFISDIPEMSIYPPLVLLDWVYLDDIEDLLGVAPSLIERIDVVARPYIKGDMTFGGIISFISKKENFAGVRLPDNGIFLNYSFFEPEIKVDSPLDNQSEFPDFRNTLVWIPSMKLNDFASSVKLKTPYRKGIYCIRISGADLAGQEFSSTEYISVGDN